jgi:3-keto-5-aminohexanoate cleavage enzyme
MGEDLGNVVLTVSSSGGKWTIKDNPHLAVTPESIIDEVVESAALGASVAHLHARDSSGKPTFEPSVMTAIVDGIRSRSNIIIQISTGNLPGEPHTLPSFLACGPELASFNLKDELPQARERARIFKELGVRPVIEVQELDMVSTAAQFLEEGLFAAPLMFEMVFELENAGRSANEVLHDLLRRVEAVQTVPGAVWSITRGAEHRQMLAAAAVGLGGWVRGGMEDSLNDCSGNQATSTVQLVAELVSLTNSLGKKIAGPDEARRLLGIG